MKALLENRERGSILFPFQHYHMTNEDGHLFVPYHWHEEIEIIYCMSGQLELLLNGSPFHLEKGDIFFLNKEDLHQFSSSDSDMSYYAYVFPLESLQFLTKDYCQSRYLQPLLEKSLLFPARLGHEVPCYETVRREIETIIQVNEEKSCAYQLVTKASILKIIACLAECRLLFAPTPASGGGPGSGLGESHKAGNGRPDIGISQPSIQNIRRIMDWLDQRAAEKITLEEAAGNFHMSPKYFSRYFKKHFQKNFSEYLIHLRIEKACMMLIGTDRPVADIAFACGFGNTSYFIKKFKELTGHTPLAYRNR